MQKLNLFPTLIFRTPVFDLTRSLSDTFDELRDCIADASPDFWYQLQKSDYHELFEANDNRLHTLWKYFNRAKYRATPFARFAAVTAVQMAKEALCAQPIKLEQQLQVHQFQDWDDLTESYSRQTLSTTQYLVTNASCYSVGKEHRYLILKAHNYSLCRMARTDILDFVILKCAEGIAKDMLINAVKDVFALSRASVLKLTEDLIDNQVLWTDSMPNITGEDFSKMNKMQNERGNKYLIAERQLISGTQDAMELMHIPKLINLLNQHVPVRTDNYLEQFIQQFIEKFDKQFVPLTEALDPELGVNARASDSYTARQQDQLPIIFSEGKLPHLAAAPHFEGELAELLLDGLTSGASVILLDELELGENAIAPVLPNTSTVIYHMWGKQPVLQSVGGCTANAILGRFSLCGETMATLSKNIAVVEANANPGVIFFDVSFQAEKHVDNINRRAHLYEAELPLSGWSTHEKAIRLSDVIVGIRQNQVILYHTKWKKRLVPRIPTAYNHQRTNLEIYRFLAALQCQSVQSNLSLSLTDYFPGLGYYPRVQYKNIIVSPAMWRMSKSLMIQAANNVQTFIESVKSWFKVIQLNEKFHTGRGDQKLVFDPASKHDLEQFAVYCKQQKGKPVFISEALINPENEVIAENDRPFFSERILSIYHTEQIYQPFAPLWHDEINDNSTTRKFYPGDDWIYLEIYCHQARANEVLTALQRPIMGLQRHIVGKWFFIRYVNPRHHLRLRLHLQDKELLWEVIQCLKKALETQLAAGFVEDLQIKTYMREVERYQHGGVDTAEDFFFEDSKWILILLKKRLGTDMLYHYVLQTMARLIALSFPDPDEQWRYVKIMAARFSEEMALNTIDFKLLNKSYKAFRLSFPAILQANNTPPARCFHVFEKYICKCKKDSAIKAFTADAIHMHINRLFSTTQRQHEAILYQYLLNDMKRSRLSSARQVLSSNEHEICYVVPDHA